jgi:hypothetical protein
MFFNLLEKIGTVQVRFYGPLFYYLFEFDPNYILFNNLDKYDFSR